MAMAMMVKRINIRRIPAFLPFMILPLLKVIRFLNLLIA
jgi:hypothetical protein